MDCIHESVWVLLEDKGAWCGVRCLSGRPLDNTLFTHASDVMHMCLCLSACVSHIVHTAWLTALTCPSEVWIHSSEHPLSSSFAIMKQPHLPNHPLVWPAPVLAIFLNSHSLVNCLPNSARSCTISLQAATKASLGVISPSV